MGKMTAIFVEGPEWNSGVHNYITGNIPNKKLFMDGRMVARQSLHGISSTYRDKNEPDKKHIKTSSVIFIHQLSIAPLAFPAAPLEKVSMTFCLAEPH